MKRAMHFKVCVFVCEFVVNTFFWRCSGVESRPLSDSVPAALIPSPPLLSLAAGEEDVSAMEAQVLVGFAAVPLTAELQPKRAAATALLQVTQSVFTWIM